MPRIPRVVLPGLPHHVTQRGVRGLDIFATPADRTLYLSILAECAERYGVEFWGWCLMSNHTHFAAVPRSPEAFARTFGETHRRYARTINERDGVTGHLFQDRYFSFPIQEDSHLLAVIRYIEQNPVRSRLASSAEKHPWSSARHHVLGIKDPLIKESPVADMVANWKKFLRDSDDKDANETIRRLTSTGRPYGESEWIARQERKSGRKLAPTKRGWKKGRKRKK